MKKVLVLGSGMVAKPMVEEMLAQGFETTCVDMDRKRAESMVGSHSNGRAVSLDINDETELDKLIKATDLVCSLLPPPFHPRIARRCLANKTNMLTTSYLTEEMKSFHDDAKKSGLLFLNETGLDPGIDHMAAMDLKDDVISSGGRVVGFQSHCGGFPARSAANNPIRYKFSWNPSGVLGALTRESCYMHHGKVHKVPGKDMLSESMPLYIPEEGVYESTPNGDGLYYAKKYGMQDCNSVRRGTLRYPGWARFWSLAVKMGWLDREHKIEVQNASPIDVFKMLTPWKEKESFVKYISDLSPKMASHILEVFDSLGFFSDHELTGSFSCFDVMLEQAQKHWQYRKGEVDKVILFNHFDVEMEGEVQVWTSLLSQEGQSGGHSAMSILVGLPCAIAGTMILNGTITATGVKIPLKSEIYQPILSGLKTKGVVFEKKIYT